MQGSMSDQECIRYLLNQALEQETSDMKHEEKANLVKLCSRTPDSSPSSTKRSVSDSDKDARTEDIDLQALELYHQVRTADERVRKLRQEVPGDLVAAMTSELQGFRPAVPGPSTPLVQGHSSSTTAEGEAHGDEGQRPSEAAAAAACAAAPAAEAAASEPGAPVDLEAWRQLNDVTNKVPALMARLDHTLQRLTRIIGITEADASRPSPRTVEKALLGHRQPAGTCLDELDHEAGAENTRQRLAYDLAA